MSYLIDSDWLIDAQVGVPSAVQMLASLRNEGLAVSIVSYGELFEGAIGTSDPEAQFTRFRLFFGRFALVQLTDPVMEVFARTRAELRRSGNLIPDMDLLIAASAIHHDLTLLTRNVRHFQRVPHLRLR